MKSRQNLKRRDQTTSKQKQRTYMNKQLTKNKHIQKPTYVPDQISKQSKKYKEKKQKKN